MGVSSLRIPSVSAMAASLEILGGSAPSGLSLPISHSSLMGSRKEFLRYRIIRSHRLECEAGLVSQERYSEVMQSPVGRSLS